MKAARFSSGPVGRLTRRRLLADARTLKRRRHLASARLADGGALTRRFQVLRHRGIDRATHITRRYQRVRRANFLPRRLFIRLTFPVVPQLASYSKLAPRSKSAKIAAGGCCYFSIYFIALSYHCSSTRFHLVEVSSRFVGCVAQLQHTSTTREEAGQSGGQGRINRKVGRVLCERVSPLSLEMVVQQVQSWVTK